MKSEDIHLIAENIFANIARETFLRDHKGPVNLEKVVEYSLAAAYKWDRLLGEWTDLQERLAKEEKADEAAQREKQLRELRELQTKRDAAETRERERVAAAEAKRVQALEDAEAKAKLKNGGKKPAPKPAAKPAPKPEPKAAPAGADASAKQAAKAPKVTVSRKAARRRK
jgi:hypothetical protein